MVRHQVHDEDHPPGVQGIDEAAQRVDVAEQRVDVTGIGDVVAVVDAGGAHDRREPHAVHAQGLEVADAVDDALQVTGTVAIRVGE